MTSFICDRQDVMEKVLNSFKNKDLPKSAKRVYGNFRIEWDTLVYRPKEAYNPSKNVIATRLPNGTLLGNASILELIGRYNAWGVDISNRNQSLIQRLMENDPDFIMLPFSVFIQAGLNVDTLEMVENGGEETVLRAIPNPQYNSYRKMEMEEKGIPEKIDETVHFTGAKLFTLSKDNAEKFYFIFDIDREEIKHKIFNPFLVKLPQPVKTIAEAYEVLEPVAVKTAKALGKQVERQGEWFFIPSENPPLPELSEKEKELKEYSALINNIYRGTEKAKVKNLLIKAYGSNVLEELANVEKTDVDVKRTVLKAGPNRPNYAEKGITIEGISYVSGKVSHAGREHRDINLKNWYIATPNTAVESFTITGDID
jgi:hypothetical protein